MKVDKDLPPKNLDKYIGYRSGKLEIIEFSHWHYLPSGGRHHKWLCRCDCGNETIAFGTNVMKKGHTTSCGCERDRRLKEGHSNYFKNLIPQDMEGKRFGRLIVESFAGWIETKTSRVSTWSCVCDCGNTIVMRRSYLVTTPTPSCGCYRSEVLRELRTTHGQTGSPTYISWMKMKERCNLKSYAEQEYYQDRGITVCPEWNESFEKFLEDMGERPEGTTLDRINSDLGYYKENCRWADLTTQSYNRRKRADNSSGRTGVYLREDGTYEARIGYYGENILLASKVSYKDAVKAREEAEIKYYGWNKE